LRRFHPLRAADRISLTPQRERDDPRRCIRTVKTSLKWSMPYCQMHEAGKKAYRPNLRGRMCNSGSRQCRDGMEPLKRSHCGVPVAAAHCCQMKPDSRLTSGLAILGSLGTSLRLNRSHLRRLCGGAIFSGVRSIAVESRSGGSSCTASTCRRRQGEPDSFARFDKRCNPLYDRVYMYRVVYMSVSVDAASSGSACCANSS
jgi:hypothetical protein